MSKTTEVARDKLKTLSCTASDLECVVASRIDGIISDAEATTINDDNIPLTSTLKATVSFDKPPAARQHPRIFIVHVLAVHHELKAT